MTAEAFERFVEGRTMDTHDQTGRYGVETFLPGRRAIWRDAEQETVRGIDCSRGVSTCATAMPVRGRMVVVPMSLPDERLRDEIFRTTVLPRWLQRCGADCTALWRDTIGAARGIALPAAP